jgi:hypothetical protein
MFFYVEHFGIFLTFFWFRRTMKFETHKPASPAIGGQDRFERNKSGVTVTVRVRVNEADN